MMNNPLRELAQSTSAVAQGGSTTSSHSTRQGSRKDVDVYCEPITATISQPTDELIEVSEDENYYLRFTPLENLTNTKQSCKQQTKNSVAKKTATEDEYVRARLISDNPLTKVDVKMAEVVTNVVDAEKAETSYELVVKPTKKGNMKGYRNMAYEKDALDATSNGQDVDKSTSAIVRASYVLKSLYVHIVTILHYREAMTINFGNRLPRNRNFTVNLKGRDSEASTDVTSETDKKSDQGK